MTRFLIPQRRVLAAAFLALGFSLYVSHPAGKPALAQNSSASASGAADLDAQMDPYQRSGLIYYNKLMGKSGWERGQQIYFLKCWICHNDYTIKAEPTGAPTIKGLYKRPAMLSGKPVTDENVAAKIREGGPRMPAYRSGMNDTDLADLVTYLREKCCWDEQNPPANPRYKGQ